MKYDVYVFIVHAMCPHIMSVDALRLLTHSAQGLALIFSYILHIGIWKLSFQNSGLLCIKTW